MRKRELLYMQRHIVGKVSVSAFLLLMVSDNIIHCDIW